MAAEKNAIKEARRALRDAERMYQSTIATARDDLVRAESMRKRALQTARQRLKAAEAEYEARLQAAGRDLAAARYGSLVASYGSKVRLYSNRLETQDGTAELDARIRASVEATGTKTDKIDSREVVLLLDTPAFDSVVRVNPDDAISVRELAARINTAAKNADKLRHDHATAIEKVARAADEARADQTATTAATSQLVETEADTASLEAAAAALEAAESDTARIDAARATLLALDPSARTGGTPELGKRGPRGMRVWWRRRRRRTKAAIAVAGIFAAFVALGAVTSPDSGENDPTRAEATTTGTTLLAPAPPPVPVAKTAENVVLAVSRPRKSTVTVETTAFVIRGFATPGSTLRMNGGRVPLRGNRFSRKVQLRLGKNTFAFRATKASLARHSSMVTIVRQKPLVSMKVASPAGTTVTVRSPSVVLEGIATPGSTVSVNGRQAVSAGGRFEIDVSLEQGRNVLWLKADRDGFRSRGLRLVVTRRLSPTEIAAEQARKRQAFMDGTISIPYNQLIKDPDTYAGTNVKYYGEILQIQQSGGSGFMLLYVTDLGYDLWTDQIWVNYTGNVRGAEGDKLTVYGTVTGSQSYETQIGGETYVPEVEARYIVE